MDGRRYDRSFSSPRGLVRGEIPNTDDTDDTVPKMIFSANRLPVPLLT